MSSDPSKRKFIAILKLLMLVMIIAGIPASYIAPASSYTAS